MFNQRNTEDCRLSRRWLLQSALEFSDYAAKFRRWWLVIRDGEVDVCIKDPGHEIDLEIVTDVRTLTGVWMGDIGLGQALRDRRIRLSGPTRLKRDISTWLGKTRRDGHSRLGAETSVLSR